MAEDPILPEDIPEKDLETNNQEAMPSAESNLEPAPSAGIHAQTDDMEVHHPHHVHHKKKWKDYLFEFFMLSLAVSSGFFVENIREHYVEHERAGEYAVMLKRDLVFDTLIMDIIVDYRTKQQAKYDSIRQLIDSTPFEKINQKELLQLLSHFGEYRQIIQNNATLLQLKSSGSLRYFKNAAIVDELNSYEEDLKHREFFQNEEKQHFTDRVVPFIIRHFNYRLIEIPAATGGSVNFPETAIVDFDKKAMMEFSYLLNRSAWFNREMGKAAFAKHKEKAANIIKLLQKEYPDKE